MSEEEKKAIVRAREHLTNPASNYLSDEEIETLLDLIDEQQRVMKSQETIIMEQEKEIDNYKKQEFGNLFNGRYVSKDKIRDKIKELEEQAEKVKEHYRGTYACLDEYLNAKSKIQGYKELLEEENNYGL